MIVLENVAGSLLGLFIRSNYYYTSAAYTIHYYTLQILFPSFANTQCIYSPLSISGITNVIKESFLV